MANRDEQGLCVLCGSRNRLEDDVLCPPCKTSVDEGIWTLIGISTLGTGLVVAAVHHYHAAAPLLPSF
eukprot:g80631.t1